MKRGLALELHKPEFKSLSDLGETYFIQTRLSSLILKTDDNTNTVKLL